MGKGPKTPPPTAQENAAGKVAVGQWNEYVTQWHRPIMDWAQNVNKDKTPEMGKATGITNADLAQQSAGAEKRIAAGGMSPNSGRVMGAAAELETVTGTTGSGAAVSARQGVEDARLSGLQQVANVGMGQKTEAVAGLNEVAAESVNSAITNAVTKQQGRFDKANAIGGMAGVVAGGYVGAQKSGDWAGGMTQFDAAGQEAVRAGASSGPGGYWIDEAGNIRWNR